MAINDKYLKTLRDVLHGEGDSSENAEDLVRRVFDLLRAAEQATEKDERIAAAEQPEIVRVMRLYVFEGPRAKVEQQIRRSLQDGTKEPGGNDVVIHVATIGTFPEILNPRS